MRVLFFAQLKDVTGCDAVELAVAAPLSGEQLWAALLEKYPALTVHRASVRLARNLEYAGPQTLFNHDDEAALIPPVSGG
jgi:molybdopterin converting factor subunit 1